MLIFQFDDYKSYFLDWVAASPNAGRGQFSKLSQFLSVSSVFITQVFRGDKDLNMDQAFEATEFMGLTDSETDYFLLLVQEARATGHKLKTRIKAKRQKLKLENLSLKRQIIQDAELSEEVKATFYGHWHYSAIRLACSIPGFANNAAIASKFQIPIERVNQVLSFLHQNELILKDKKGWKLGPKVTHLAAGSPFIISRQVQWRTKGFEAMAKSDEADLFYTSPMSLDEKTFSEIRQQFSETIKSALEKVRKADSEMLVCMNLDWFKI